MHHFNYHPHVTNQQQYMNNLPYHGHFPQAYGYYYPYQSIPAQQTANQSGEQGISPANSVAGGYDFQKAVNQFEQLVQKANQISPIIKQIGGLLSK